MSRIQAMWESSVGKKAVMAVTGLILFAGQAIGGQQGSNPRTGHLPDVHALMGEYIQSAAFDGLLVETVRKTFPAHEHEHFVAHYRGLQAIQAFTARSPRAEWRKFLVLLSDCYVDGPRAYTRGTYEDPNTIEMLSDQFNENDLQLIAKKMAESLTKSNEASAKVDFASMEKAVFLHDVVNLENGEIRRCRGGHGRRGGGVGRGGVGRGGVRLGARGVLRLVVGRAGRGAGEEGSEAGDGEGHAEAPQRGWGWHQHGG
mgnify:CR=1 FL=1